MSRSATLVIAASVLLGVACSDDPVSTTVDDLLVVQAFLYTDQPVRDVRLTRALPLGSLDTIAPPVSDAVVELVRRGVRYALVPSDSAGYYHYAGTDLIVAVGDTFRLEIESGADLITAETVVPPPPVDVSISGLTLEVPVFGQGPGRGGFDPTGSSLEVTWSNSEQRLHYVVVETRGDTSLSEPIFPEGGRRRIRRFRFVSLPTVDDVHAINLASLEFLGEHAAAVYRINEEYAQLYDNRIQDSRDLNEPPTNIVGGLGVFSAFTSDSVFFDVVRPPVN